MNDVVEGATETAATISAQPRGSLSVVQYAVQSGAPVSEVRALLELEIAANNHQLELIKERRAMDKEDKAAAAKLEFDEALARFRGFNIVVPKTKQVTQTARSGGPGPTFKQSEFDVVIGMISPALSECGFSLRHDERFSSKPWTTDGVTSDIPWVYVRCILTHKSGHAETLDLEGPPDTSGSKNPLQEMQSAASFLKRHSSLAITGTPTGGEDDESCFRPRQKPGDKAVAEPDAWEALRTAGRDAALVGMKPLTEWWGGLTAKQRRDLSPDFPGLRKDAAAADQNRGAK